MSWLDRLFKDNSRKEIECELLDETDKSIKVKYGIHITYLPKKLITFDKEIPNIIEEVAEEQKRIEGKNKQLESGDKEDDE